MFLGGYRNDVKLRAAFFSGQTLSLRVQPGVQYQSWIIAGGFAFGDCGVAYLSSTTGIALVSEIAGSHNDYGMGSTDTGRALDCLF